MVIANAHQIEGITHLLDELLAYLTTVVHVAHVEVFTETFMGQS